MPVAFATDFTTERVVLNWPETTIARGDSLTVYGHVSSTDSMRRAYSRYVYVEVVSPEDSVYTHQMCGMDDAGDFVLQLKTAKWWAPGMYYVRAYTRLMQNFSADAFGFKALPLGIDAAQYEHHPAMQEEQPLRQLEVLRRGDRLLWSINQEVTLCPLDSLQLYCFSDETGLEEVSIPLQGRGVIDLSQMHPGRLLHLFLLDKRHALLDEGTIALAGEGRFPETELSDMVGRTMPDSLLLEDDKALGRWLQSARFVRFSISDVLDGRFSYRYPCEQQMTIRGRLMPMNSKKPVKHATVTAMNFQTKETFSADTDDDGRYIIAVRDYMDGEEFFVSAKSHKKNNSGGFYKYNIADDPFPEVSIPYRMQVVSAPALVPSQRMAEDHAPKSIQLGEANIRSRRRVPEIRPDLGKYMEGNYISLREHYGEIPTMEQAVERIWRVQVVRVEKEGEWEYKVYSTRGLCTMQDGEVGIMLDGMRIDANELMELNPYDIEDVEYLLPAQALKYGSYLNGLLYVRTVQLPTSVNSERKAKGVWIQPLGLTGSF